MARRRDALTEPIEALAERLRLEGASPLSEKLTAPLAEDGGQLVSPALVNTLQEIAQAT